MGDLNVRAAKAMGWTEHSTGYFRNSKNVVVRAVFTEDRNAAHELLVEVGRRGLGDKFMEAFLQSPSVGYIGKSLDRYEVFEFTFWCMKAPLPLIVQAACEVLEKGKQ